MNIYKCLDILMDDDASEESKEKALTRAKECLRESDENGGHVAIGYDAQFLEMKE